MVRAGVLDVAFERHGNANGWPVVLLHGFPYDIRAYDRVAAALADAGPTSSFPTCAVTVPRALSAATRCARASKAPWPTICSS